MNNQLVDVPVEDRIRLADRIVQLKGEKQDIQNQIDERQAALIEIVGIKDEGRNLSTLTATWSALLKASRARLIALRC